MLPFPRRRAPAHPWSRQQTSIGWRHWPALVALAIPLALSGCGDEKGETPRAETFVRTIVAEKAPYARTITLTGEISARTVSDLSFRVSGRIIERNADVGSQVKAGDVLARLDAEEQQADLASAEATVRSAESLVDQRQATLRRQQELLTKGFTTRSDFDAANAAYNSAVNSAEGARAALANAREALGYTLLKAEADGVIVERKAEIGQLTQAAQTVFRLAHNGQRDAIFRFYETPFINAGARVSDEMNIALVNDPKVTAIGKIREISPTVDPSTGTVRVKVGLADTPEAMTLGSAVTGTGTLQQVEIITLPWTALATEAGEPAVWVLDPKTNTVERRRIHIFLYEKGRILVSDGLEPGTIVVSEGTKLLRNGQTVTVLPEVTQ
ncbi:efflux RND transporter periplasmic adaptor subunit [Rhizobium sp. S95]|uniref:Efflux RND transporter periplasmic adaptor subunit n=1 Tax=Ciceribacter sichuanensis TaxID=2949647 RepID=A0AAJ1BZW5_9HYPH|nr:MULTISPECIES: efflux RND transporter periplasmic adaptor subunit [unclassified Ciceribacter]MCM2397932.1 efflux RND transporter periplasmic adaptor subunit [Ciceribacter sp. S95]MCO5959262.1 efflux RND transporter periplasmic adaptor subunit [Ciceribacter sp. S101]